MDQKKSPNRRSKRQSKLAEDNYWDCSVCTYRNTAEAFKCLMCDVRKGTSTRKPRINTQLVAQQVAQQYNQLLPKVKKEGQVMAKPEFGIGVAMGNSLPGLPPVVPVISSSVGGGGGGGGGVSVGVVGGGGGGGGGNTGGGIGGGGGSTIAKSEKKHSSHGESKTTSRKVRPKLKNVDRSSAEHKAVTVNNVTVIITEFQPKRHQSSSSSSEHNHSLSSGSGSGSHGHTNSHHHHTLTNGCVENGIHSDSTNLSNDSHSDGRSS